MRGKWSRGDGFSRCERRVRGKGREDSRPGWRKFEARERRFEVIMEKIRGEG